MTTHELKTWPEFFEPIISGVKTFEVRRDNRGFRVGDTLKMREWQPLWANGDPGNNVYTGREVTVTVTYVLHSDALGRALGWNFALKSGYVVMAIALVKP